MPQNLDPVSRGIFAGALATGPMTLAFFNFFDDLPRAQKSPLPPATLAHESLKAIGVDELSSEQEAWLTMIGHFGYGAIAGTLYSLTAGRAPGSPILKGSAYGLAVWAASYLGWIPLTGFRSQAPNMTLKRNWMMIASHIVWGASLGYADHHMKEEGLRMLAGHKKAPRAE